MNRIGNIFKVFGIVMILLICVFAFGSGVYTTFSTDTMALTWFLGCLIPGVCTFGVGSLIK